MDRSGIFQRQLRSTAIQSISQQCKYETPLSLKAVYSRSQGSAEQLVQTTTKPVGTYLDTPALAGRSLDDLLARKDTDAVIIALPIPVQPEAIKKAIRAEKHVLSENSIAKGVETAVELLPRNSTTVIANRSAFFSGRSSRPDLKFKS